jgi:hypothetical protein
MVRALLVIVAAVMAAHAQINSPAGGGHQVWPWFWDETSSGAYAINTAANYFGQGFYNPRARTISTVEVWFTTCSGTITSNPSNMKIALMTEGGGKPGTSVEEVGFASVSSGAAWSVSSSFSGSATVAENTYVWFQIRNADGTPASNNCSMGRRTLGTAFGALVNASAGSLTPLMSATSSDSGSSWTRAGSSGYFLINWTNGDKDGFPIVSATVSTSAQVYDTRESGQWFKTGPFPLRVIGVSANIQKTASPGGLPVMKIYRGDQTTGRVLVATSAAPSSIGSSAYAATFFFSSPVILSAGTYYTVAIAETTNSDTTSTNRYTWAYQWMPHSDAGTASLFQVYGSVPQITLSTNQGSTWTNSTGVLPMALILEKDWHVRIGGGFSQ